MKQCRRKILSLLAAIVVLFHVSLQMAWAEPEGTEDSGKQKIFLSSYSLTDEKIVPGSDFELKIILKNTGSELVEQVIVDVLNPSSVYPVYGTFSQAIVDIPGNGEKEISFHYNALEYMEAPVMDFQIVMQENGMVSQTFLRAPVGTESPFNVIATSVPPRAVAGENTNCSMTFKYIGKENVSDIKARMDVNGKTVQTSDVGKLNRFTTKTQSMFTTFEETGKYVVELYLDYADENGTKQSVQIGTSVVEVSGGSMPILPGMQEQIEQQLNNQVNEKLDNAKVLVISGTLILIIFAIIVFLVKKK